MNQHIPYKTLSVDNIYDSITSPIEEGGIPKFAELLREELDVEIDNLVNAGILIESQNQDSDYCVRINSHGKSLEQIKRQELSLNPLAKCIFYFLIENINVLWTISLGAQKTKTNQMIRCIQEVIKTEIDSLTKTIPFLFSLNSLDLTDQSTIRFINTLDNVKIFVFASRKMDINNDIELKDKEIVYNPHIDHVKLAIDIYITSGGKLPLFISLPNNTQVKKVLSVLDYIISKKNANALCGYSLYFDEADAIYPNIRDCILKYIVDIVTYRPNPFNYGTYWVSATIDTDNTMNFEEVLKAYQYVVYIDPTIEVNYRNIDIQPDAIIPNKFLHQETKESNNDFIKRVVMEHLSHFKEKVKARNGDTYYRRVIVLADRENENQKSLARLLAKENGISSIIYNQTGFPIYWRTADNTVVTKLIKRKDFPKHMRTKCINEKIKWIYDTTTEIQNSPLFVIGNKMIDRGLSFHYAPRIAKESAWLLTDIIMGYYSQTEYRRAAQAVARLWGIIAHRPEYCGSITHWLDARTREMVLRDARKSKHIQDNSFIPQPIMYLTQKAEEEVEEEIGTSKSYIIESSIYIPSNLDLTNFLDGERIAQHPEKINNIISNKLVDDFRKAIGIEDKDHPTSYKYCNGYIVNTRISCGVGVDYLTSDNRIIIKKLNDSCLLKTLTDISLTNSINTIKGNKNDQQTFVIIPVYPNENSKPEELCWIYRYAMPLKDNLGQVCFINDNVIYNTNICIIKEVYASKNGDRVKACLIDEISGIPVKYKNEFGEEDKKIPGCKFIKI
jgi:hypothetical protein